MLADRCREESARINASGITVETLPNAGAVLRWRYFDEVCRAIDAHGDCVLIVANVRAVNVSASVRIAGSESALVCELRHDVKTPTE
jgi:hypothetical protein